MYQTEEILGSKTRARLLAVLLPDPRRRFYLRQLMRITGIGSSSVQAELAHLLELGIVREEREGSNRYFSAVPHHPAYRPLRELVLAVGGVSVA